MGENVANYVSEKGLISKIYKELMTQKQQKMNIPIKTWQVGLLKK